MTPAERKFLDESRQGRLAAAVGQAIETFYRENPGTTIHDALMAFELWKRPMLRDLCRARPLRLVREEES